MTLTPYEMELIAQALHLACSLVQEEDGAKMLQLRDKIEGFNGRAPEPVLRQGVSINRK